MQEPAFRAGSIRLADGRRIAVSELGSRGGLPVLYLHGAIGTPLRPTPELLATVERLKLRWLAVQRPGFGGSSPDPGRSLLRFAGDVDELADGLGLGHLAVLGVSAGGPYALACAHALPDRVAAVTVCSSLSPGAPPHAVPGVPARIRVLLRILARAPGASTVVLDLAAATLRRWPCPRDGARAALRAAVAGGSAGLVEDYLLSCRPWGFDPADIRVPVELWHGVRDRIVPVEHAWQLAAALPACRASFSPDDGHFFFRRRIEEIVGRLAAEARAGERAQLRAA
jgi:pimeloyl-ACP methyl ester carboxylesterase